MILRRVSSDTGSTMCAVNGAKVFVAWSKSAEGKAWEAANSGEKYPPASSAKSPVNVGRAVLKKARKVGAKSVNAPAKKVAKKIARKPDRKAKNG